jgi:hypothetical protein
LYREGAVGASQDAAENESPRHRDT